ncbi:helix-turn-helix domain-containing protein [Reichenbachiella ulvae]|uniref:Helix-turn-helix transcriptional regulator n=1 Tax=Reichenbachiella ulvae TaxID=2980104 RepID=A0ABT3CNN1_9BACT|nr:helix-turn-helix transcriptional regulator [Reichenbachiella ulvae]MCV9385133.1 helix-turn-helix transcriptional regulator [Reichenbachiella ulvae]
MTSQTLHVKNMVCPRCIASVVELLEELQIHSDKVELGSVALREPLDAERRAVLSDRLSQLGFELLMDEKAQTIAQIKALVIEQVHHQSEALKVNFSTLISQELKHEYSSLSRLFSAVEGITIEKYILKQKIERVKELLFYQQLTLSEIAYQMNYSSAAHLSAQFKKETGMTPSEFKSLKNPQRRSIDAI